MSDQEANTESASSPEPGSVEDVRSLLIDDDDLDANPVRDERPSSGDDEFDELLELEEGDAVRDAKAKQDEMKDDEDEEEDEDEEKPTEKSKAEAKEEKPGRTLRDLSDDDEELITKAVASGVVNLSDALQLHDAGKLRKILERIPLSDGQSKQEPADAKAVAQADPGASSAKLFKHRLTKEDYPDETLTGFAEEVEEHVSKTRQEVQTQRELINYLINQNAGMHIDRMFSKIGEEYSDVFGKGDIDDVSDKQASNRVKVKERVEALAQYHAKSGEKKSSKQLFQEAVDSMYAERRETKAKNQAEQKRQQERRMPQPSSTKVVLSKDQIADQKWKAARQAEREEVAASRKKFALKTV